MVDWANTLSCHGPEMQPRVPILLASRSGISSECRTVVTIGPFHTCWLLNNGALCLLRWQTFLFLINYDFHSTPKHSNIVVRDGWIQRPHSPGCQERLCFLCTYIYDSRHYFKDRKLEWLITANIFWRTKWRIIFCNSNLRMSCGVHWEKKFSINY